VELYLHSPSTLSWHGDQLKKAQGQLYLPAIPTKKKAQGQLHLPAISTAWSSNPTRIVVCSVRGVTCCEVMMLRKCWGNTTRACPRILNTFQSMRPQHEGEVPTRLQLIILFLLLLLLLLPFGYLTSQICVYKVIRVCNESPGLLGCVAVYCCGRIPTLRRIILPPSSGWRRWRQESTPKRWYPTAAIQGDTTQNTTIWIFRAVKTSKLTSGIYKFERSCFRIF
jgi:hypothetical protein